MVILDIDMGYCLVIWEMTASIRSSSVQLWEILSLCAQPPRARCLQGHHRPGARSHHGHHTGIRRLARPALVVLDPALQDVAVAQHRLSPWAYTRPLFSST
jgi:hypothetical protein